MGTEILNSILDRMDKLESRLNALCMLEKLPPFTQGAPINPCPPKLYDEGEAYIHTGALMLALEMHYWDTVSAYKALIITHIKVALTHVEHIPTSRIVDTADRDALIQALLDRHGASPTRFGGEIVVLTLPTDTGDA